MTWSTSFPGTVMAACGVTDGAFEVHRSTGVSLRVGGEAYLCFDCGPDGGVYHPEANREAEHRAECDCDAPRTTFEDVRKLAKSLDRANNRFEVHEHATKLSGGNHIDIKHSHTDGDDVHRHPDAGWAQFPMTTEDRKAVGFVGPGEKRTFTSAPSGPDLAYVEPTDEERIFRVVGAYRYVNPGGMVEDRVFKVGKGWREGMKPPDHWSRAAFRHTMALTVDAIRHGGVLVGPSAIHMTANRMRLRFRLTPVYEIEGWTPTPWLGLP